LFARALLKKNASLILMDEPTSDLDSESEQKIREAIQCLKSQGKTVVMIAHRLTIVQDADCIHLLEDGKITATGTHVELVARGGLYHKMVARQSLTI
jgi:ABC-type multidrug transport system fused ATPase/permease subunit